MATKKFELKSYLTENRETVIAKFNSLTEERFYNGITLRDFMLEVMKSMELQNIKSASRAASMLPMILGNVYTKNCKVMARDAKTEAQRAYYQGTAYMAMV